MGLDKSLQQYVLDELNKLSTADIGKDIFTGGYLFYNDDSGRLQVAKQVEDTYLTEMVDTVAVSIINYSGERQPIPNLIKTQYTMPIRMLIETKDLDIVIGYIETFQDANRGSKVTIDSLETLFNFTPIDRAGGLQQHAGKVLQPISFTMFSNSTDKKLDSANDITIKIDDEILPFLSYSATNSSTTDDFNGFSDKLSKSVTLGKTFVANVSTYLETDNTIHKQIISDIYSGDDVTYSLEIDITDIGTFTKTVQITSISAPYQLGDYTIYSLIFKEV